MLVGLTGKLGSGKDTAAARLAEIVDLPWERIAYADKLKNSAVAALGNRITVEQTNVWKNNPDAKLVVMIDGSPVHRAEVTIREYLQFYGTEAHREVFGDNFWVDAALPMDFQHTNTLVTITDVRFPNELARVHALGGIVVRIKGVNEETGTHASEQVLEGVDWEIDNTLRDDEYSWLDAQLRHMVRSFWTNEDAPLKATMSGLSESEVGGRSAIILPDRLAA